VIENLTGAYFAPQYKDAAALVLFVIVILFKPEGLFGRREERRV
jgi:branched-chain amino acid transport system permease protein